MGGAATYQKVLDYFKPKFLLGMTATPERSDDFDIYALFHHQIAYEIRLHDALAENMLVPFHYHGVCEITVNGEVLDDNSDFTALTCEERVRHILYYADLYGSDTDRVKGLVFCRSVEEARTLAAAFVKHGRRAVALTGASTERERQDAIGHLEAKAAEDGDYWIISYLRYPQLKRRYSSGQSSHHAPSDDVGHRLRPAAGPGPSKMPLQALFRSPRLHRQL